MIEILGTARNLGLVLLGDDETLDARAECVLIGSEPVYSVDPAGVMNTSRSIVSFRFSAAARQLRQIAKDMGAWADALDELKKRQSGKNEPVKAEDKP